MKYIKNILAVIGLVLLLGFFIQAVTDDKVVDSASASYQSHLNDSLNSQNSLVHDYNVYAIPLPEEMSFAGEAVPLEKPNIRKRLDRELLVNTYWQSNGLLLIKRAHQYFPIIEPILEAQGVPEDFKYLAVVESGLQQVVSPAGASGFWQFISSTGKRFGLEVNSNVDERYHIEKETKAACRFLKHAKEVLGSWTLAAAAYNAGIHGISREIKQQEVDSYYDLWLNSQTWRYMFRILALKEILSQPHKYGFNFTEEDLYQPIPTHTIAVDSSIGNLVKFSKNQGINYKILKILNPWLLEDHLDNDSGKRYEIKLPDKGYFKP